MCAIVGLNKTFYKLYLNNKRKNLIKFLDAAWDELEHRGTDSYGVLLAYRLNEKICFKIYKGLEKKEVLNFLKKESFTIINNLIFLIAHNRKASIGKIDIDLAHPIVNKQKNTITIHNGTKREIVNLFDNFDSDTQAINTLFSLIYKTKYILNFLDGAGVIFNIYKGYIYNFIDFSRSLYVNEDFSLFASEPILYNKYTFDWYKFNEKEYEFFYKKAKVSENFIEKLYKNAKKIRVTSFNRCIRCGKFIENIYRSYCDTCLWLYTSPYKNSYKKQKNKKNKNNKNDKYPYMTFNDYYDI